MRLKAGSTIWWSLYICPHAISGTHTKPGVYIFSLLQRTGEFKAGKLYHTGLAIVPKCLRIFSSHKTDNTSTCGAHQGCWGQKWDCSPDSDIQESRFVTGVEPQWASRITGKCPYWKSNTETNIRKFPATGPASEATLRCKPVRRVPQQDTTYHFENLSNFTPLGTYSYANCVGWIASPKR